MKRLTIDLPTRRLADAGFHEISRLRAYTGRPVGHSSCAIIRHQSGPSSCRTTEQVPITAIIITQPPLGEIAMSAHACVCVRMFVCPRSYLRTTRPIFTKFLCVLPMAVARPSSGVVSIRYVGLLPVLWMTSYLLISRQGCSACCPAEVQCTRSLGLGYKLAQHYQLQANGRTGLVFGCLK